MKTISLPLDIIVRDYRSGMTLTQVASKHGVSKRTILRRFIQFGIPRRTNSESNRTYTLDTNFFQDINSELKAYWLGFLLADGNIGTGGRNRHGRTLRIALKKQDERHLTKLRTAMGSSHPIKQDDKRGCVWLCITSIPLTAPLEKLGWHEFKKSGNTKILHSVPNHLATHLIRGLIDGDGWIHKDIHRPRYILGFTDLHESVVAWLNNEIQRLGFISQAKPHKAKGHKNWYIAYSHRQVPYLLRALYHEAHAYLDRKFLLATQSFASSRPL